jgi:hypothetical protein
MTFGGDYSAWQALQPPTMYLHSSSASLDKRPACSRPLRFEIKASWECDTRPSLPKYEIAAFVCHDCQVTAKAERVMVKIEHHAHPLA